MSKVLHSTLHVWKRLFIFLIHIIISSWFSNEWILWILDNLTKVLNVAHLYLIFQNFSLNSYIPAIYLAPMKTLFSRALLVLHVMIIRVYHKYSSSLLYACRRLIVLPHFFELNFGQFQFKLYLSWKINVKYLRTRFYTSTPFSFFFLKYRNKYMLKWNLYQLDCISCWYIK